jgi:hypothetical protein
MKDRIEIYEFVLMLLFGGISVYTGISLVKFMLDTGFNF